MDNLTRLFLMIMNSMGAYCLLTLPILLWVKNSYPLEAFLILGFVSAVLGFFLARWEEKMYNEYQKKQNADPKN